VRRLLRFAKTGGEFSKPSPVAGSEPQQAQIHTLRQAGKSLRAIAAATGLGLRAVHTVVSKTRRTDRTSRKRISRASP
jgi:hypothetical protein